MQPPPSCHLPLCLSCLPRRFAPRRTPSPSSLPSTPGSPWMLPPLLTIVGSPPSLTAVLPIVGNHRSPPLMGTTLRKKRPPRSTPAPVASNRSPLPPLLPHVSGPCPHPA